MICVGWRYCSGLMLVSVLSSLAGPACAENDYPAPPYREYEKICRNAGNTGEVIECLSDHLSVAEKKLEKVVSLLTEWLSADPESQEEKDLLLQAQQSWSEDVDHTCDRMVRFWYELGSMSRTEPIRCKVLMTMERDRLLRILYYQPLRYLERNPEN